MFLAIWSYIIWGNGGKKQKWFVGEMDLGKIQHTDRLLHKMYKAKQGPLKVKLKYLM